PAEDVAQEEPVGVVTEERIVPALRGSGGDEEWRRVPLAVPAEPAPAEGGADDLLPRGEGSAAWRRHALRLKTARTHGRGGREGMLAADPRALDGADPCPLHVVPGDQGRALRPVPGDHRDPGLRVPRCVMAASYPGQAALRNTTGVRPRGA